MVQTKYTTTYRRLFTVRFILVDCLLISTILIASELKFVSNKDFISPQNQHTDVRFEAQGNFIKWTRMRPKTMITEEAAIWSWSSHSEWWAGSGLAASPLVRLQPNRCELQTAKYPIKQDNDEYQMCNCGSRWTQVENLRIWKPAMAFYARGAWPHIINVWLLNQGFSSVRGLRFGTGLKPKLTWFARSWVFPRGKEFAIKASAIL